MPLSEADVSAVLSKLVDPNTGKDYTATRSVKSVKIAGAAVTVEIELGYRARASLNSSGARSSTR
jgi:ATP-binding protein involved in chromosome partitioning